MKWSMQDTMIKQVINAIKEVFKTIKKNLLIKTIQVFIIDVHSKDLTNLDLGSNVGQVKRLGLVLIK